MWRWLTDAPSLIEREAILMQRSQDIKKVQSGAPPENSEPGEMDYHKLKLPTEGYKPDKPKPGKND